ncbi:MAG: hypothetical protein JNK32_14140 [Anaerolineales bacterium]|nr:hypothetical protein [Anaerolineales bacterium]
MKPLLGCGSIFLFFLAVILIAIPLACIATVAVPIYNKEVLQEIACPPGTTLVTGWEETTYTEPGEKVLYGYCEDAQGNQFPAEDLGYGALEYFPKYFLYSLGASFVLMLMVVIPLIFIYQFVKRKFFSNPPAPPPAIGSL